ncbi:hypothetical protein GGX14DRAFT_406159 [Mycena pura]|uniref:Uncharacterized protein n=1 Tax=Mycena pura TaxID=153505 RepID=A0AAD6UTU4_9AGAR|nr:hypothetical protein GGX14DRAFT_406159 [Mycena pura]
MATKRAMIMARTQTTGPDVTMNQNAFSGLIGALAQMATPRGPSASARRLGPGTYPGFGNARFRAYRADRATGRDSGNFKLRRKGYQPRPGKVSPPHIVNGGLTHKADQAEGRREHKNKKRTRRNRKAKQEPEPKIEAEDMTIGDPIHADVAMDDNTSMVAQDGSIFADSEDTMSINNDEYELEEDNGFNAAACKLIKDLLLVFNVINYSVISLNGLSRVPTFPHVIRCNVLPLWIARQKILTSLWTGFRPRYLLISVQEITMLERLTPSLQKSYIEAITILALPIQTMTWLNLLFKSCHICLQITSHNMDDAREKIIESTSGIVLVLLDMLHAGTTGIDRWQIGVPFDWYNSISAKGLLVVEGDGELEPTESGLTEATETT